MRDQQCECERDGIIKYDRALHCTPGPAGPSSVTFPYSYSFGAWRARKCDGWSSKKDTVRCKLPALYAVRDSPTHKMTLGSTVHATVELETN